MNDKLRGTMAEKRITQKMMAKELEIQVETFNRKMNGHGDFTRKQFIKMAEVLKVTTNDLI